jgi:hypothetical protein
MLYDNKTMFEIVSKARSAIIVGAILVFVLSFIGGAGVMLLIK